MLMPTAATQRLGYANYIVDNGNKEGFYNIFAQGRSHFEMRIQLRSL